MLFNLTLTRAFAILLITNSHLGSYYPLPGFAAGGMIGNCLFFIVSGWALTVSLSKSKQPLAPWLFRRIYKIYLPVCAVVTALLLTSYYQPSGISEIVRLYVLSKDFWFVPAIASFYIPLYFGIRHLSSNASQLFGSVVLFGIYLGNYYLYVDLTVWSIEQTVQSKIFFYLFAMFVGRVLAERKLRGAPWTRGAIALTLALIYIVSQKVLKTPSMLQFQFLAQLLGLAFAVSVVYFFAEPRVYEKFTVQLAGVVEYLSSRSLYIYISQVPLLGVSLLQTYYAFPWNLMLFLVITLTSAEILFRLTSEDGYRRLQSGSKLTKLKRR